MYSPGLSALFTSLRFLSGNRKHVVFQLDREFLERQTRSFSGHQNDVRRLLDIDSRRPFGDSTRRLVLQEAIQGIDLQGDGIGTFRFSDGSSRSWAEIDPLLKSTLYFAIQFTLWQFLAVQRKLPVLLDVASNPPVESVAKISLAAARYLAKQTQVLVLIP